jgi:hypothetical protein
MGLKVFSVKEETIFKLTLPRADQAKQLALQLTHRPQGIHVSEELSFGVQVSPVVD